MVLEQSAPKPDLGGHEVEAEQTAQLWNDLQDLDLTRLVQSVTDTSTRLVGAQFGSFFYNVLNERGESYMLYTLSGAPAEAFAGYPMPRNTELFASTFRGEEVVRSGDISKDPRYGTNAPYHGMPAGHLAVRSYLAAPVISRSGEVLGGLFFGHAEPERFTASQESLVRSLASQAAIAIDNARLFEQSRWIQEELKRSNEDLRRANRDMETFAYSASHDLQEPLRNVAINAQLLERAIGHTLEDEPLRFLQSILQGANRMEALVKDLLTYTHAIKHAGSPPIISARQVLDDVLQTLAGRIEETSTIVTAGHLPEVSIHKVHLAQLFQNLIGNAIKYHRSGQAPRIIISALRRDVWWVFNVADNGIGIDLAYAEQIFDLFKRLHSHSHSEFAGNGVGLAICRRIVEQYNGRIWLEKSTPGDGSTFCFALPDQKP
jgi:signal transduction histidine kinase